MTTSIETFTADLTHSDARVRRALLSLHGLSVGDAFGERFFVSPATIDALLAERALPRQPWRYTDDTEMALAIVEVLKQHGEINQDRLAKQFAVRWSANPDRGYGAGAHMILRQIAMDEPWREAAGAVFDGTGSMGNGGAMRASVVGAWFADQPLEVVAEQARRSAEVTHAHPEGQAGAIAVAVAAALAWRARRDGWADAPSEAQRADFIEEVIAHTPRGEVRDGLVKAVNLAGMRDVRTVAAVVGNGSRILAQDTAPLTVWCAARHLEDFTEAMWVTVSALGDRDTTCAIVGGVVAMSAGAESIPPAWLEAREPLEWSTWDG